MTVERALITDVLATRYASTAMLNLWSPSQKIIFERKLWLAVLKAQIGLGVGTLFYVDAVEAYERTLYHVDLESLEARERKTRHDIKAKIEEWNDLAGYKVIHTGMTSRDLTDNVEQMQVRESLSLVRGKLIAVFSRFAMRALEYRDVSLMARTHNVPAQITTLGKRFAGAIEEFKPAFEMVDTIRRNYPLRGIKGPVGTQQDMLELFGGDATKVAELERRVAEHLGFETCLTSVGQVYPRSYDLAVVSALVRIGACASSFATTLRLMAGNGLVTEGFSATQTGSSAMPHKMNARTCERICGFYNIVRGFETMVAGVAGNQWNEGDVSCSVVRRVALPGAFFAIDGMLESLLTVLDEFGIFPHTIEREVESQLPFLATTAILVAAVQAGMDRESAHACIKKHAVGVVKDMRDGKVTAGELLVRLGTDPVFPLGQSALSEVVSRARYETGTASHQVGVLVEWVKELCAEDPSLEHYAPEDIL